jgi:hypothetical protein
MNEVLQAVVSANQAVARQARDLNVRAGEQVFTVLDRTGLQAFLSQQLGSFPKITSILKHSVIP